MSSSVKQRRFAAQSGREFLFMMASLMALQALAIDAMLPALGQIADDLRTTDPNQRQLVVGVFLLSAGVASILPGSLADRFGRKPVLLGCLSIYIVFSFACAMATDFTMLLVGRALQAIGSGGLAVLPSAIVRDRLSGDRMARTMSLISTVFMLVPILAPGIGQIVLLFAGWRWIFVVLAVLSSCLAVWISLRLEETLHPEFRQPVHLTTVARNMGRTLTDRTSIGYVVGSSLTFGSVMAYVSSSQQLLGEHFGAGTLFPVLFGLSALMLALSSFGNSRIVERFGARRVSHTAVFVFIVVGLAQVRLAFQPDETLFEFMVLISMNMALLGFIGSNFSSIALQPFARTAGAASSVQSCVRMAGGALVGVTVGQAYDGSARPLATALLLAGICCLGLVLFSEKGKLFRRLNPPDPSRSAKGKPAEKGS